MIDWIKSWPEKTLIEEKIVKLFLFLVIIFPFGLALFFQAKLILNQNLFLFLSLFCFVLLLLFSFISYCLNKKSSIIIAFFILLAISVRWFSVLYFDTIPISDFAEAFEDARKWQTGPFFSWHASEWPHWGVFSLFLQKWMQIVGVSFGSAKFLNMIAQIVAAISIFLCLKRYNRRIAFFASMVLLMWPSFIFYGNILTGEHLYIAFLSIGLIFLVKTIESNSNKHYYIYLFFFSLLFALANTLKETSIIIVPISMLIIFFFLYVRSNVQWFQLILTAFIIFFVNIVVVDISHMFVERYTMVKVNEYNTGYFLATGLNFESRGMWSESVSSKYSSIKEGLKNEKISEKERYKKANSFMYGFALNQISDNLKELPALMLDKFEVVWQADSGINWWVYDENKREKMKNWDSYSDFFLFSIFVSCLIGLLVIVYNKKSMINPPLLFSILFCISFASALTLIEAQQRYRSILYPPIAIISSYGINFVTNHFENFVRKLINISKKKMS